MSEHKRVRVRPRKKISSIFKGISFHHENKGQKPWGITALERTADTGSKSSAREQKNHHISKVNKAPQRHRPILLVDKFTVTRSGQEDSAFRVNLNISAFVTKQQDDNTTDMRLGQVYGMKI